MLASLSGYLYEHVLYYLAPRDYAQLCLTSRTLRQYTTDYLVHFCNTTNRDQDVNNFFTSNHALLLPYEGKLYACLLRVAALFPDVVYQKLPLYREILAHITESGDVRRVSVITSYMFSYLGDTDHVYLQYSEQLHRDVIYLKEISWLIFCTNLPVFSSGVYRVRLHMQIRSGVVWKGDTPMVVRLLKCKTKELVRQNFIHPSVWGDVSLGKDVDLSYNNYNDKNLRIVPTDTPSWYFLVIDNVCVVEGDELYFVIDDRQNVFWKSGKSWDFLEIIRIK